MVAALERHPDVRLSLHYSGPLLDWLRAERPAFIDRLAGARRSRPGRDPRRRLLRAGPRLTPRARPDRPGEPDGGRARDAVRAPAGGRLARRTRLGAGPADRRWSPPATTGRSSTTRTSGRRRSARTTCGAPYTTDDQGQRLRVFATEQGLRYRIPFRDVDEVIDYLREHATEDGERVGTMGDDGEKFGAWPTTFEHCWGARRWVDRFFEALEANADWLTTTTPTAWLAGHRPIGRVYVPTGSYAEMGEWALPPDESRGFAAAVHDAEAEGRPEARWLRGASWRNFQVRYREINDLHKQMLRTSDKVEAMPDGPARASATGPPVPGPVERLLLARPVRRHLHRAHAPGHLRAPHRRRGPGRRGRRAAPHGRATRSRPRWARRRPAGRPPVRSSRSIWPRVPGSAAGTSGRSATPCARSCAADRRPTTRRCATRTRRRSRQPPTGPAARPRSTSGSP